MNRRRIRITVETDRFMLVRQRANVNQAWCDKCGQFRDCASIEETCALISADGATVARLLDEERLHSIRVADDLLLVCFVSILRQREAPGWRLRVRETP